MRGENRLGTRSRRLAWARGTVALISLVACFLLVKFVPPLATSFTSILLGQVSGGGGGWIGLVVFLLFLYFVATVCLPFFLSLGWMSLAESRPRPAANFPMVSVIIPAFNEEQCMLRSLHAVSRLQYPAFEVIVVNDGSTDYTFSLIEQARVRCIHLRRNQGKAAALNAGITAANGSIIVFSDSDSWLDPMALRHLVQGFTSDRVGAVSGTVSVAWPHGLIRQWQHLEYAFGQFFIKAAQIGSGASVAICPGPVCAYSKEVLEQIGGFTDRTITEDFDATLCVVQAGYQVEYVPEALAYTDAPATWHELGRQRLRWFRGHLQAFLLHRDMLFARHTGMLGLYWLPIHYLFLGYLCSVLELVLIPAVFLLILLAPNSLAILLSTGIYFLLANLFVALATILVLIRARQLTPPLLGAACLLFPYLLFLNWIRLRAVINEVRGKQATWSG